MKIFTEELTQFINIVPEKLKEYYRTYLTLILSGMMQTSKREFLQNNYFVPIAFETFLKKGIPNKHIKAIQKDLESANVIIINHSYLSINSRSSLVGVQKNAFPKGYKINHKYLQTPIMIEAKKYKTEIKKKVVMPKLKSYHQSLNQLKFVKPIHVIYSLECSLNILGEENDYISLQKNLQLYYNLWQFENIKSFSRCEAGRLHNRLTRLKKGLRKYIKGFDKMVMIDISNCQMFLLACLMKKNKVINQKYFNLVTKGEYKEYIHKQYKDSVKHSWYSMQQVKSDINTWFFGQESTYTYCKEIMRANFKNVHDYLMEMKVGNYKNSSLLLQQAEANLMVNNVLERCKDEGIKAYLIHDAIIVPFDQEENVMNIITFEFWGEYGLEPHMKKETF